MNTQNDPKAKKITLKKFYHLFTDGCDEHFHSYQGAKKVFDKWKKDGYQNIRLWKEGEYYEDEKPSGDFVEFNCLKAVGEYPS